MDIFLLGTEVFMSIQLCDANQYLYKHPVVMIFGSNKPTHASFSIPYNESESSEIQYFTQKAYPFSASEEDVGSDKDLLIWDLFSTNHYYVHPQNLKSLNKANSLALFLYAYYVYIPSFLVDSSYPHGFVYDLVIDPLSPFEESYTIKFTRHISHSFDGWSFDIKHIFLTSNSISFQNLESAFNKLPKSLDGSIIYDPKGTIPFPKIKFDTDNLIGASQTIDNFKKEFLKFLNNKDYFDNKLSKSISKHFSSNTDYSNDTVQSQSTEKEYNIKEPNMSNISMCSHMTIDSHFVTIINKQHAYANVPKNMAICSNPSFQREDKITPCGFGLSPSQCTCPMYNPSNSILKRYNTKGSDSVSFYVTESIDLTGKKVYNLINSQNEQTAYVLHPSEDFSLEDVISELDSIVKEVLSSWPEEVSATLEEQDIVISKNTLAEKKSFILSLVS